MYAVRAVTLKPGRVYYSADGWEPFAALGPDSKKGIFRADASITLLLRKLITDGEEYKKAKQEEPDADES